MQKDRANGVLIVPLWRSAIYWPLLCSNGNFIPNVVDWIDLPKNKENYTPCRNGTGIFGTENLKFRMLALRIIFLSLTLILPALPLFAFLPNHVNFSVMAYKVQ